MKLKKLILVPLFLLSVFAGSVTFTWDRNTETDISKYNIYRSINGGGYVATSVGSPTNVYTFTDIQPGNNYDFYVTAVNTNFLESGPSLHVPYTPPSVPPAVNIVSVRPSGFISGNWTGVVVTYSTSGTNMVWFTATPTAGGTVQSFSTTASPFVIPILPVNSYTFTASSTNASGSSPAGTTAFINGTPPANVRNVVIQLGP